MIFSDLVSHVKNDCLLLHFYTYDKKDVLTFVLMERDYNRCFILDNLYITEIYPGSIGGTLYIDFRTSLYNFLITIVNDYSIKNSVDLKRLLDSNGLEIEYLCPSELKLYNSTVDSIFNDR